MSGHNFNMFTVHVDGVLQARDDVMYTDTHVRLRHAPPQMAIIDIRTTDSVCSYTGNGSNTVFRHNDGYSNRRRIQEVMNRALQQHHHPGVMDLVDQLDVMLRLID